MNAAKNTDRLVSNIENILKIAKDEDLAKLSHEDVEKLYAKSSPYGTTIEGSEKDKKFINVSVTQITHDYWKKFIITSMVGFLNRMCDEWKVPEEVPVVPVYDYLQDQTKADTPEPVLKKANPRTLSDYEFNREWMKKRVIVKEFLEEMFQFNPDEHVRSGYRPHRADKDRQVIKTPAGQLAINHLKATDKNFKANEQLYDDVERMRLASGVKPKKIIRVTKTRTVTKKLRNKKDNTIKEITKEEPYEVEMEVDDDGPDWKEPELAPDQVSQHITKNNYHDPTGPIVTRSIIPPEDMFEKFKLYYTGNYEELREAVKDLYCEKPIFELGINAYKVHDTREEALDFQKKHADKVITEVFTIETGKWNMFDSWKEQRENVNFFTDKTILLEQMMERLKREEQLAADMVKNRMTRKKKINNLLDGEDAEGFKNWKANNSDLKELNNKFQGDRADDDCPDDAVQIDIWRVAKGGLEITKDRMFTKAEAPTFVQEAQEKAIAEGKMAKPAGYIERDNNLSGATD